ncbi:fluoride efflux transporter CrcB [uncultured Amnibacterium sp.]|uniref:fluoride efflux transporter CrcB n=1 Tax=uncultured Amnibacterium sp. TaxID=1631851 RepID=UPI0035CC27AA
MTPVLFLALSLAGGFGAVARFALDSATRLRVRSELPIGTIVINLSGSLALGLLAGFVAGHALPDAIRVVAGTGFLGGYTTFSTASVETVRLVQRGRRGAALISGPLVLVAGVTLATFGLVAGTAT